MPEAVAHDGGARRIADYLQGGGFRGSPERAGLASPESATLFMLHAPAGKHVKPPTDDFNLVVAMSVGYRVSLDFGAGRWRKLTVAGDLGLVPPAVEARKTADNAHRVLVVSIPRPTVLRRLAEFGHAGTDFGGLHATSFREPLIRQLCLRMWSEAERGQGTASLFIDTAVLNVMLLLHSLANGARPGPVRGGLPPHRLRRVIDYVREHLAYNVRLDELASVSGLSTSHFSRSFRRETGCSPHHFVLCARVDHARNLIRDPLLSLEQVAGLCGFSSAAHLGTSFKRLVGLTPSEYRRRL